MPCGISHTLRNLYAWVFAGALTLPAFGFSQDADYALSDFGQEVCRAISFLLPYPKGKAYRVLQSVESKFSHFGLNQYAVDFDMPESEQVCAAAGGKVVCVQQSFTAATLDLKGRTKANRIIIDHGYGIFSQYLHLKPNSATVREGDLVRGGQVIALSGNTGYSTKPHLHFQVQDAMGRSLPLRFADVPGGTPRQGELYYSQNNLQPGYSFPGSSPFPLQAFETNGVFITRTSFPGVNLVCDETYFVKGRLVRPSRRVVLYLLPPDGGLPIWVGIYSVAADQSFEFTVKFAGLRSASPEWHIEPSESNCFALAIAPVEENGNYWSDISVPVFLR
ncbi:MAG: M23 family metallopeptidase [Candidatus Sumerlaeaceae bacterium]|nr:M23 family metallopeptidase [Candidatus Sumerlaeaceae bacterium]